MKSLERGILFVWLPVFFADKFFYGDFVCNNFIEPAIAMFVFLKERPNDGVNCLQLFEAQGTFLSDYNHPML